MDKGQVFTKEHPSYDDFIKFHSDQYKGIDRQRAKQRLFIIHYGSWNTDAAMEEAKKLRISA